jgi:hypothetical protein
MKEKYHFPVIWTAICIQIVCSLVILLEPIISPLFDLDYIGDFLSVIFFLGGYGLPVLKNECLNGLEGLTTLCAIITFPFGALFLLLIIFWPLFTAELVFNAMIWLKSRDKKISINL